jgi:hypothetical protein
MHSAQKPAAGLALRIGALAATVAAPLGAQNLITYDAGNPAAAIPATVIEIAGLSPLYAPPGPTALLNSFVPPVLPFPPVGPLPVPPGGITIDNTNGQIWASNGPQIATWPHNQYGATPVGGPWALPPIPGLQPPWTNLVYGIAIDPVGFPGGPGPILWLTDSFWIVGVTPGPPFGVIMPPFPANLGFPFLGPVSGMDWDPITQSLWLIDVGGLAVNILPGGAPGPGHPALGNPIGPAPLPATGIAIDKSIGIPGVLPLPAIYAAGAGPIFEFGTASLLPSFAPVGLHLGLTFHAAPSFDTVQPCACPTPGYNVAMQLLGPMSKTNAAFGVDIAGLPANTLTVFAFDFLMAPQPFPTWNQIGCPLGFNLPPPALWSTNFVLANAAGTASFPVNLTSPFIVPGMWLYMQVGAICPGDVGPKGKGWVLSPFYQIVVAQP